MTMKALLAAKPAGGFSPADIAGLIAWWDASDTGTITESGGAVSRIDDKSGNGWHLVQSTAGAKPTTGSTTINSLNVLAFDGGDSLSVASFTVGAVQTFTLFAVMTAASGGDQVVMEHSANYGSNNGAFLLYRATNNTVHAAKRDYPQNRYSEFVSTGTLTTTAKTIVATHDGSLAGSETVVWLNGSNAGSYAVNNDTNSSNTTYTLYVGSRAGSSIYLTGNMAEWGIYSGALGTSDREALASYLDSKWGIA